MKKFVLRCEDVSGIRGGRGRPCGDSAFYRVFWPGIAPYNVCSYHRDRTEERAREQALANVIYGVLPQARQDVLRGLVNATLYGAERGRADGEEWAHVSNVRDEPGGSSKVKERAKRAALRRSIAQVRGDMQHGTPFSEDEVMSFAQAYAHEFRKVALEVWQSGQPLRHEDQAENTNGYR